MLDKPARYGVTARGWQGRVQAAPANLHPGVELRVGQLALLGQPPCQHVSDDLLDRRRNTLVAWLWAAKLRGYRAGNRLTQEAPP